MSTLKYLLTKPSWANTHASFLQNIKSTAATWGLEAWSSLLDLSGHFSAVPNLHVIKDRLTLSLFFWCLSRGGSWWDVREDRCVWRAARGRRLPVWGVSHLWISIWTPRRRGRRTTGHQWGIHFRPHPLRLNVQHVAHGPDTTLSPTELPESDW